MWKYIAFEELFHSIIIIILSLPFFIDQQCLLTLEGKGEKNVCSNLMRKKIPEKKMKRFLSLKQNLSTASPRYFLKEIFLVAKR